MAGVASNKDDPCSHCDLSAGRQMAYMHYTFTVTAQSLDIGISSI